MDLTDTHCHIHSLDYSLDKEKVIADAASAQVTKMICVGTDLDDSQAAIDFVASKNNLWASIGLHPHESSRYCNQPEALEKFFGLVKQPKVVAIGECGLDYFYDHSPKADQIKILKFQIELALKHELPIIFHVRDAFEDFWPIFDSYPGIRGVIHSFTATDKELNEILTRGLYIGLNGIVTFAKSEALAAAVKAVPSKSIMLETDSPYLTPIPYRGTINEPKNTRVVAEFLANLRGESLETLAAATEHNVQKLFGIN